MTNWFAIGCLLLLAGGCASSPQSTNFVRADGQPPDAGKLQLALAQCKGEGAQSFLNAGDYAVTNDLLGNKEGAVIAACMARNGYIAR